MRVALNLTNRPREGDDLDTAAPALGSAAAHASAVAPDV